LAYHHSPQKLITVDVVVAFHHFQHLVPAISQIL
jgi:hypothetical protein